MEEIVLKDPSVYPDENVLKAALGKSYKAFAELMTRISSPEFGIDSEWRYYNDGKAWLCKNVFMKKTIFWLSVWDGYFKTGFYFTEKTAAGIEELDIDSEIKKQLTSGKNIGKLIPLAFTISNVDQIRDVLIVTKYKIRCK